MKPPLSYVPALPVAVGMAAGIVCCSLGAAWPALAIAVACFAILYWLKLHYASFFFLFTAVGAALAIAAQRPQPSAAMFDSWHAFEGVAKQVEDTPSGSRRCVIDIEGCLCLAYVRDNAYNLAPGCEVAFEGRLTPLDSKPALPGDDDIAKNLRRNGIWCQAYVAPGTFRVTTPASGFNALVANARAAMEDAIVSSPIDGSTAAFLLACIVGDDAYLLPDSRASFSATGVAHVLALSGLHVGILASLLSLLFMPFNLWNHGRTAKSVLTLALVWAYAVVTGLSPSVVRASVMVSAVIAAWLLRRQAFSANSLLLAAAAIMAFSPFSIFEPGFQLSFAAVASILIVMRILPKDMGRRPRIKFFAGLALMPIAATTGSGIVYAFYFGQFPLTFIISNMVAGLLFPPILTGGFLLMALTGIGIKAAWLGWLVDLAYRLLTGIIGAISALPGANLTGLSFSAWAFLPYFGALAVCAFALSAHSKKARAGLFYAAAGLAILSAGIMLLCKPIAPQAELYIPCEKPQCMIVRSGSKAYALPLCRDTAQAMLQCEISHRGFIRNRGCDSLRLMPAAFDLGHIARAGQAVVAGQKSIALIADNNPPSYHGCDYALVCEGFAAGIDDVLATVSPDTVLLSASLHPSRAKRLAKECDGKVPCLNLRGRSFAITVR